ISAFALDLVAGKGDAARFCRRPAEADLAPRPKAEGPLVAALGRSNAAWGNDVDGLLAAWSSGRAAAIVAGQQVGFGGGPLYTIAKIASLLALQRRFAERGVETVPFFWLATEDHDYAEISSLLFQSGADLTYLSSPGNGRGGRQPVGAMIVPEELRAPLAAKLGSAPRWLREGVTFRDSFAELLVEAVGGGRIVLIDALLPELREAGRPLFRSLAERLADVETAIDAASVDLGDAGYRPQVARRKGAGYSLLYTLEREGGREPVGVHEGGVSIAGRRRSVGDLLQRIDASPESISTGVLARPILQDFVFKPAVFVGGPAEVSYYAQLASVHEMLEVERPAVALRGHILVAPARRLRALERYGFHVTELFGPLDQAVAAREADPAKRIDAIAARGRAALEELTRGLEELTAAADPALSRSLRRSARKADYHIGKMDERARRATGRLDGERWRALSQLQRILYPRGSVQDRVAGWIGWWSLWREEFVPRLVAEAAPDEPIARVAGF
ncbi:MAG TPA: bacillithiol biosynthesis BshC, partial [Thermoanaerobaculia bacterium]